MIETPKRSVTRFFIPLVDVMMLLFSMYLLLPILQVGDEGEGMTVTEFARLEDKLKKTEALLKTARTQVQQLHAEVSLLRKYADPQITLEQLKKEIELLQKAKADVLQKHLFLQVVAFDPNRDDLVFFQQVPEPTTKLIASAQDARALIDQHDQQAREHEQNLYYVILLPPPPRSPTQGQLLRFKDWFSGVPYQVLVTPP
jgi:hypothetical protein